VCIHSLQANVTLVRCLLTVALRDRVGCLSQSREKDHAMSMEEMRNRSATQAASLEQVPGPQQPHSWRSCIGSRVHVHIILALLSLHHVHVTAMMMMMLCLELSGDLHSKAGTLSILNHASSLLRMALAKLVADVLIKGRTVGCFVWLVTRGMAFWHADEAPDAP
jgi:hypothetical protein